MTIKTVYTKKEFIHLMKKIEVEHPEILWAGGQKPTEYIPSKFPRDIYLNKGNVLTTCYHL